VEAALIIACRLHGGYIVGHAISLGEADMAGTDPLNEGIHAPGQGACQELGSSPWADTELTPG
jgi:hypothetical protein